MKQIINYIFLLIVTFSFAQEKKEAPKDVLYIYKGNKALKASNFVNAEANYRKAISENPSNATSKYNLGNAYYKNKKVDEALNRFNQAQKVANTKPKKHKVFHNMGNSFMQKKEFGKAVEMYKEALRNNPTDNETRYNLALAKEKKKKDDKKDKKDKKDKNKDKKDDKKEEGKDGDDKKDKSDKKDKKNDGDQKNKDKPKKQDQKKQPKQGQLSPQQIQQLLKAMDNQEQKLQQKLNAKKGKGVPVKNDKDW